MSMACTKKNFERILADSENKVLALSGKWGTGKSHMWRSLRNESTIELVKNSLYVSLFGVTSIGEFKMKLVQSSIPILDKKGPGMDALKSAINIIKQFPIPFLSKGAAVDEIALLSAPFLAKDKFIVIDDIERKHDKLTLDEVLGFIDDFTQNYGCRILLILNTDQLTDKKVWEKLREKVIDEELCLETEPSEAFNIAIALSKSQFESRIKPIIEACGLTNIRIIRKVIRAVNRILVDHPALPDEVLNRTIPSIVLLAAIHYKGFEDGPTMEFILNLNPSASQLMGIIQKKYKNQEKENENHDEEKMHAKWKLLLNRIGITDIDEFEMLVFDYLNSGLFDQIKLDAIINRYCNETQIINAQARVYEFSQVIFWNPELSDEDLLSMARDLLKDIPYLAGHTVTSLHNSLLKINGGRNIAEEVIALSAMRQSI